jgi:hypothetical protein
MKTSLFLIILLSSLSFFSLDKENIYNVLSGSSYQDIDNLIIKIENQESSSINKAYRGSLLAKRASFEKNATKKIAKFKAGVQLLESEISDFPKETEHRFLRLCIQENCPKILKYNKNITEDVELIISNFSKQPTKLKTIITNYSKTSKSLDYTLLK